MTAVLDLHKDDAAVVRRLLRTQLPQGEVTYIFRSRV